MCRYNSGVRARLYFYQWQAPAAGFRSTDAKIFHSFPTVLLQASFSVEIQVVLAHRVREFSFCYLNFYSLFYFIFLPLDLTSTFTVIFYMTRFYLWKNRKVYCMLFFCHVLSRDRSFKLQSLISLY
jgi:hypothetical protein